ncbi:hypothetical protein SMY46_003359 [Cronobacter turicensis]|uniref:hypothetical protein n=1 Tax=Cronobacter turicensis TaxID=413502 RepID=UPI0014123496|nr:hypothetical protein [Cronobacter turicensis]EKY3117341.1 hypothetical protein [Cronobacter turicensis]ELU8452501.1 hypothetical protein [Cronobacter turicensis]ELY4111652.1 hypothetical protein [Cronobacter turicensis]ELY4215437.1 hypothetical protein [Cronobacter turicensis]EMA1789421.1 hypothetical protein [Cronobacter turicensis]
MTKQEEFLTEIHKFLLRKGACGARPRTVDDRTLTSGIFGFAKEAVTVSQRLPESVSACEAARQFVTSHKCHSARNHAPATVLQLVQGGE